MVTQSRHRSRLSTLQASFGGELIDPDHPAYDRERKVWNGSIDRRPAIIARCRQRSDVIEAMRYARLEGLSVAVRSGGHSFPGFSVVDDGIVIDLRSMQRIEVRPEIGRVRAEAGVLLGELDRATQAFGLAVPLGSVSHTGIAGLTLGGGFGWTMRKHGLTIDQLVSAEMVTPDGDLVRASATENPDLFWALRGGGGNFGIVTRFEYRLCPVGPSVTSALVLWPLEDGAEVTATYRDWAAGAARDLTTALVVRRAPALDVIPPEHRGRLVVGVIGCWLGPPERGARVLEPVRRLRRPLVDLVSPRPFVEHQGMLDAGFPHGIWIYSKASDVPELSDDVLEVILNQGARLRSARSGLIAWQLDGAVADVGAQDTAFSSSRSGYLLDVLGATDSADGFDAERDWARGCWDALAPHRVGEYVNWQMDEGQERVRETYGEARYRRLQAVKRRFDPENVLRRNHNILPA